MWEGENRLIKSQGEGAWTLKALWCIFNDFSIIRGFISSYNASFIEFLIVSVLSSQILSQQ